MLQLRIWFLVLQKVDLSGDSSRQCPDFCTVYVISKAKMSSVRNASRPVPHMSPLQSYIENIVKDKPNVSTPEFCASRGKAFIHTSKRRKRLEVEVLSCIRHPNMVLLLGACPEYGCIVYEYMANGSLDDRLFRRGKTQPLSWQVRFRIAADIATGLNFLHQTKPEPLVHRDLKPGNILLDRYYVAKIGDVGLARLVPPSVADHITQYCKTSAAGTFCYIDPEYQQSGMLGVKSDVYSLGIVLLQLLTAKPPMGLAHHVEHHIEKETFADILDQSVPDWPVEEALSLAKVAIQCAELRRKDRPDLEKVVLPELERLRDFADERTHQFMFVATPEPSQVFDSVLSYPQSV